MHEISDPYMKNMIPVLPPRKDLLRKYGYKMNPKL